MTRERIEAILSKVNGKAPVRILHGLHHWEPPRIAADYLLDLDPDTVRTLCELALKGLQADSESGKSGG